MKSCNKLFILSLVVLAFSVIHVEAQPKKFPGKMKRPPMVTQAIAVLHPTAGNNVHGVVKFIQTPKGVRVIADVEGLTPGKHGFHIHEFGDCSSPDGKSAGGHFNPTNQPHGSPDAPKHHMGDLGNLEADANGKAHLDRVYPFLRLMGPMGIIGRGVIIHSGKDDLKSQPTGNAGKRVACGVIGIAKGQSPKMMK